MYPNHRAYSVFRTPAIISTVENAFNYVKKKKKKKHRLTVLNAQTVDELLKRQHFACSPCL